MAAVPQAPSFDRMISKLPIFEGREGEEYRTYIFKLESAVAEVHALASQDFAVVRGQGQTPIQIPDPALNPLVHRWCRDIYFALVMTTSGPAQAIVQTTPSAATATKL